MGELMFRLSKGLIYGIYMWLGQKKVEKIPHF